MMPRSPNELSVEAVDDTGRALAIVFKRHRDFVEVYQRPGGRPERSLGHLDRAELFRWIAEPVGSFGKDDLELSIDYSLDSRGRLAITTHGLKTWTLSPDDEARFNRYL